MTSEADATTILEAWGATLATCGLDPGESPSAAVTIVLPPDARTLPPPPDEEAPADGETLHAAGQPTFLLREQLGSGGMGVVFRAEQRSLGRKVALKRLLGDTTSDREGRAFAAEARITASLDHPNIVPVYTFGESSGGELFLAMKCIEGEDWSEILRRRDDLEDPSVLRAQLVILQKVVEAVAFAHERGFIHRDLKPHNVMVGQFGEVYVLDWGLAVDVEAAASTAVGPAGTPAYMAPEMAHSQPLSMQTDIYLLGAMLYEVLYGRPPHGGATVLNVLVAALKNDLFPLDPSAPKPLVAIATRCLATAAEDRYGTIHELREALERYLSGETRRDESARLYQEANRLLAQADQEEGYGALFEADAVNQAALQQWPENGEALELRARVGEELVRRALEANDLVLAESLLRRVSVGGEALREELERRRATGDARAAVGLDRVRQRAMLLSAAAFAVCGYVLVLAVVVRPWFPELASGLMPRHPGWDRVVWFGPLAVLFQVWLLAESAGLRPGRSAAYRRCLWALLGSAAVPLVAGVLLYDASRAKPPAWWAAPFVLTTMLYVSVLISLTKARIRKLFYAGGRPVP
jgi:hypothetical protein